MIQIRFFASFREQLGIDCFSFQTETPITVTDLINKLQSEDEKFSLLNEGDVLVAKNQELTDFSTLVERNDEVAFFPPVTGG
ncbi:MAG: MoaD/ThiS family protein [Pseudomonadota bacterium]